MQKLPILLLLFLSINLYAQELVVEPAYNGSNDNSIVYFPEKKSISNKTQALSLPFFDNFYTKSNRLDSTKWEIWKNAFITHGVANNPPDFGSLTLDGSDYQPRPYSSASFEYGDADLIQTAPIDLSTNILGDSIYLSFYYLNGGLGDKAEINDTLKVFFYNGTDWDLVWYVTGDTAKTHEFKLAMIPLNNFNHLTSNFNILIKNKGSRVGMYDLWHLDYFYLNKFRTINDTSFVDIAFKEFNHSIFSPFTQIPYNHLNEKVLMTGFDYSVNNFSSNNDQRNISHNLTEELNNQLINSPSNFSQFTSLFPGSYPISIVNPLGNQYFNLLGKLNLQLFMNANASDTLRSNDTLNNYFPVDSIMAYDDGEAEGAYGLRKTAIFAQKFYSFTPDFLRAVWINFVPINESADGKGFRLVILDGEKPDTIIYSRYFNLEYKEKDYFKRFDFDSLITVPDSFYIGIEQADNKPLGIGFDMNYNNNNLIVWDSTGGFVKSILNGTLMIRGEFFNSTFPVSNQKYLHSNIEVFPNPTSNILNINNLEKDSQIEILDIYGKLILTKNLNIGNNNIQIESLNSGLYILNIIQGQKRILSQKISKINN